MHIYNKEKNTYDYLPLRYTHTSMGLNKSKKTCFPSVVQRPETGRQITDTLAHIHACKHLHPHKRTHTRTQSYLQPADPDLHLSHNQTPSNLPFLPGATSARAFSMGETPLPEEGDMLEGGVVATEDTEDATPTSSSTSACSFSFLAHALRHSLLHSSLRRPLVDSHFTGVERITLSQLAHVPCCDEIYIMLNKQVTSHQ